MMQRGNIDDASDEGDTGQANTLQNPVPPQRGFATFIAVLVNTALANLTTSFLWFSLTFWAFLETQNVITTGVIGGAYMLFLALLAIPFGTFVDRHRKHRVMVVSSLITLIAFAVAAAVFFSFPQETMIDLGLPWFWIFSGIVLVGAVIENMRNIALSTTVTLLVPVERHANANGLVGTVGGIAFIVTSALSGFAVGYLGMGWTIVIALVLTTGSFVHLLTIRIPENEPAHAPGAEPKVDVRGSIVTILAIPGLMALLIFSTFNNFIGGIYMALMDPYGLSLMSVQAWGALFAVAGTGFIVGGALIAWRGLGKNPVRTLLIAVIVMGVLGAIFTIREWWLLYAVGIWLYMLLVPAVEAAEQTVIQKVVPFRKQGRVFGFAAAFESASSPITAILIAPIAQYWVFPYMNEGAGQDHWGWLLGEGNVRGIALIFLCAGIVMVVAALLAFMTRSYRTLSRTFAGHAESVAAPEQDTPASPKVVMGGAERTAEHSASPPTPDRAP